MRFSTGPTAAFAGIACLAVAANTDQNVRKYSYPHISRIGEGRSKGFASRIRPGTLQHFLTFFRESSEGNRHRGDGRNLGNV